MRKELVGKILVLGIICLFIGVGVQPAFASDISISMIDDTTPPEVELTYKVYKDEYWMIHFTAICTDDTGIRDVIFTWNGMFAHFDSSYPYEWVVTLDTVNGDHVCAIASDFAGNWAVDCLDIYISKEDCDCQTIVSDIDLNKVDKTIDRLDSYRGLISLLSKRNSKVAEYYYEGLSNSISTLTEIEGDNKSVFCVFLLFRWFRFGLSYTLFTSLSVMFHQYGLSLLEKICENLIYVYMDKFDEIGKLAEYYECWWEYLIYIKNK